MNDLPVQTIPGFGPAAEVPLFRQKDPKPLTPRLILIDKADALCVWSGQLATFKQGPPVYVSIHP